MYFEPSPRASRGKTGLNSSTDSGARCGACSDVSSPSEPAVLWDSAAARTVALSGRVLLLNPLILKNGGHRHFLTDWTGSEYPSSLILPPMEFLSMHALLTRAGANVDFLDASAGHIAPEKAVDYVLRKAPELLVMASTHYSLEETLGIVADVKRRLPKVSTALFGASITAHPESALRSRVVDYVILGEPEKPVLDLAEGRIRENLAYLEEGIIHCLPRKLLEPLDWLPHPARHLLNPMDYVAPFSVDYPFTVVTTSRGCPHAECAFCAQHIWTGGKIRYHSVDYTLEEIEVAVRRHGYREIFFRDQVFTGDRDRTLEICRGMTDLGLHIPWRGTTRVTCVDEELLGAMKEAGCYQISYGFESASQEILDANRKGITLDQSARAASMTRAAGIEVVGNFIVGLEGDTERNLKEIASYAIELDCSFAQFIMVQFWRDPPPPGRPESLSRDDLVRLSSRAYRRFYLRPAFAKRILKRTRRPGMLKAILRSAYKIITEKQIY